MIKSRHGKGGEREIVIRWNAKGLVNALHEATLIFRNPPQGYRGESMTVAKQRNTRGQRLDVTVVYYHSDLGFQPLDIEQVPGILEEQLELHRPQPIEEGEEASAEVARIADAEWRGKGSIRGS